MGIEHQEEIETSQQIQTDDPHMAKVILLNDDYTSMDFVIEVLIEFFHKSIDEAINIMLNVHKDGSGECGIYPYDIAMTKVHLVIKEARSREFPLKCIAQEI